MKPSVIFSIHEKNEHQNHTFDTSAAASFAPLPLRLRRLRRRRRRRGLSSSRAAPSAVSFKNQRAASSRASLDALAEHEDPPPSCVSLMT